MKDSLKLVEDSCRGVRPSRIPTFDIYQNDAVLEHFGGARLDGRADGEVVTRAVARSLDGTRHLGVPGIPGSTFRDEIGNEHVRARWTSWVKTHAFATPEEWAAFIPRHTEQLQSRPGPTAADLAAERARQAQVNARLEGTMFIHCTPSTALNTLMFGYRCGLDVYPLLWADDPAMVRRWLRAIEADTMRSIERAAHRATSPLAMIYSDVAYHDRLMYSPATMRAMGFFDDVAAICRGCHDRGLQVIFHSDGNVMEILDLLVAAGIDGLNPIEHAAGMDPYAIRKRHPGLILVGGMDVSHLLPFGTAEEVLRETRRMIREVGSEGRLIIGSSTEVGNDVPLANYLAFLEETWRG
jgi:hypothetical protein